MMQQGFPLDRAKLSCSICLDLLKDPVSIPCGHSYCMSCIKTCWDQRSVNSCPQCRQTFTARPVLVKNTMLADLVEELKKVGLQTAPADHCYAGPEDVSCDLCAGRKLKALKSCLVCLVSYCEIHLQPHYNVAPLKKHRLVKPSKNLQENICHRHNEVMKMFCRTDQQCICYLCSMDEHKGHDTVSAAAETTERQRELEVSRQQIRQRIQIREFEVEVLQQEAVIINHSADKAVEDSEKIFNDLIRLIEGRRSYVKQHIKSQQNIEAIRVQELQEKLEQEIGDLRRKDAELHQLSQSEDHSQFLQNYPSLSRLPEAADSPRIQTRPLTYFQDVTAAVSKVKNKLQDVLSDEWTQITRAVTEVDVLLPQAGKKFQPDFSRCRCELTLDPNTASTRLTLSEGNTKVEFMSTEHLKAHHPDRFSDTFQVLSRNGLTGRCYWEVEKSGGGVSVAVAYKNFRQRCSDERFGASDESWALEVCRCSYNFIHNNITAPVAGPLSSRVGVYLDHSKGILSFYSISEKITLLHKVQTIFTQPLYAGLQLYGPPGNAAKLC